jgi:hypothetical protein
MLQMSVLAPVLVLVLVLVLSVASVPVRRRV